MYKQEQKEKFISYYLRSKVVNETTVRAIFHYSELFEQQLNKDISMFIKDEIVEFLKSKQSRSLYSLQNIVIILKHYTEYVINTGQEPLYRNDYALIGKEILKECISEEKKNDAILSREDINELQINMLNYTDKAILECLFVGISGSNLKDLTGLCIEQIDRKDMCIYFQDGRVFPISNKLYTLLIDAFNETEMVSYGQAMKIENVEGIGRLYKEKANAYKEETPERKFRWVLRRVTIWRQYFDLPVLTMKSISTSGLVHDIKEGMKENGLSLRGFLKTERAEKMARMRGFKSKDYVNTIYEKVVDYV